MLTFCESAAHVDSAAASDEILALTPEAAWHCQQSNRAYRKLEEFYCERALARSHSAMVRAELEWLAFVDSSIGTAVPAMGEARFQPALATSFLFQNLLDEYFFAAHALRGLCERVSGPMSHWRSTDTRIPDHLHPHRSLVPELLQQIAGDRARILPPLAEERSLSPASKTSWKDAARGVLRNRPMGELRQLRNAGWLRYLRSLASPGLRGRILVLEGGYDLDPLALELRRAGFAIGWMTDLLPFNDVVEKDASWMDGLDGILNESGFWKPLAHCGLGRDALFERIFRHWWAKSLPQLWLAFQRARELFSRKRYAAVLAWEAGAGTLSAPILQAAREADLSRVIVQHGSTARTSGTWWFSWLAHADKLMVYGRGTQAQLERTWPPSDAACAEVRSVGSPRLDALRRKMTTRRIANVRRKLAGRDRRPIAIYVPTYFGGYGRATSDAAGYPEVLYFETQQRVLRVFAEFPGVRLLYKDLRTVNSLANPIPEFLASEVPNASIMPNPPRLAEAFFAADLIIVDHVITALGEALQTAKPIIAYDPGAIDAIAEAPEARALLRRRVRLAETPEAFEAVVRQFLEQNDFSEIADPDHAFQDAFSTRGASAAAAAA
ncbi:MAG: hypothetical protein ABI823_11895 [Bryobacteraceae bacterium]